MDDLSSKKCIPCEIGTPPMPKPQAQKLIAQINNWQLFRDHIEKRYKFKNFKESLGFVNKVGQIAEKENHHPDIIINYNRVILTLMTYASKGLTENDFILASKIDNIS